MSGPSIAIHVSKLCAYVSVYTDVRRFHLFFFGGHSMRCASVVMTCTPLLYSIVGTDGSASASPRVEVASGLVWQITSRRAGGSARTVESLQSQATGGRRQNKYSWCTRRDETNEAWRPSSGLSGARGADCLKDIKQARFWNPHAQCSDATKKTFVISNG